MTKQLDTTVFRATRPFGWRDKVGYLFGDLANDFIFLIASGYLMVFYTNVLGIEAAVVGLIFLLSRLVDAFADVAWGRFLDRHTPAASGRFRTWLGRGALPLIVLSALMYVPFISHWDSTAKLMYAAVTYFAWGLMYTVVNISYGSMASVMSPDPSDRASLSVFRGAGANIAGLFVAFVPPLFLYATVDGVSQVLPPAFFWVGLVFSLVAGIFYVICYTQVRERVHAAKPAQTRSFGSLLGSLARNRALLALLVGNLILMLAGLLVGSMAPYLWLNYFNDGALSGAAQLMSYLPGLLVAPLVTRLASRFGKRELIIVAMFVSAAVFLVMYMLHLTSPFAFIALSFIAGLGLGVFNLLVWAIIGDVIDHEEVRSGERDDATVYSVNTWARKVGLALAGGLGGIALGIVGFQAGQPVQSADTVSGIYAISTLLPGIMYALVGLIMLFWYPLTRVRVQANVNELAARRASEVAA